METMTKFWAAARERRAEAMRVEEIMLFCLILVFVGLDKGKEECRGGALFIGAVLGVQK